MNIVQALKRMADQLNVDIFILSECPISIQIFEYLNARETLFTDFTPLAEQHIEGEEEKSSPKNVRIIARNKRVTFEPIRQSELLEDAKLAFDEDQFEMSRLTLLKLMKPDFPSQDFLLIGGVHLVDKINNNSTTQREEARRVARRIRYVEKRVVRHFRTIVAGDFNMNPHEEGMVLPDAFNSVSNPVPQKRRKLLPGFKDKIYAREIQSAIYPYFYNPMWRFWNQGLVFPGGTHAYTTEQGNNHLSRQWHMLDQVLVRPEALPYFKQESLQILSHIKADDSKEEYKQNISFVKRLPSTEGTDFPNWEPDSDRLSDHLPILFQIKDRNEDV